MAGCDRPLWWRGRRLSQHAVSLDPFFPPLERLRRQARAECDDWTERELRWTIGIGRRYRWTMHEAAHGDRHALSLVPSAAQLNDWRTEAVRARSRRQPLQPGGRA
jgi:hypothetical protein